MRLTDMHLRAMLDICQSKKKTKQLRYAIDQLQIVLLCGRILKSLLCSTLMVMTAENIVNYGETGDSIYASVRLGVVLVTDARLLWRRMRDKLGIDSCQYKQLGRSRHSNWIPKMPDMKAV